MPPITLHPIGIVQKQGDTVSIEVYPDYSDGMLGLEGFSHIDVLFWCHENDTPTERAVLRVHPRRDPANPLTGVFATRSPKRPNPMGLTRCRIVSLEGRRIRVDALDARDGSPVLDIKCHIPDPLPPEDVRLPAWV